MTLIILSTPSLRGSIKKVVEYLREVSFDRLFLPFPETLTSLFLKFVYGEISFRKFLSTASERNYLPEPIGCFRYLYEPLIKAIPLLKTRLPRLEVACYKDPDSIFKVNEFAAYKASLTLYTAVSGRVKIREWKELLKGEFKLDKTSIYNTAYRVIRSYHPLACTICVAHLEGRHLFEALKRRIPQVKLRYIGIPYFFTPLEVLKRLASIKGLSKIPDEIIEKCVRLHADYIRNYIVPSEELDIGYLKWLIKRFKTFPAYPTLT